MGHQMKGWPQNLWTSVTSFLKSFCIIYALDFLCRRRLTLEGAHGAPWSAGIRPRETDGRGFAGTNWTHSTWYFFSGALLSTLFLPYLPSKSGAFITSSSYPYFVPACSPRKKVSICPFSFSGGSFCQVSCLSGVQPNH